MALFLLSEILQVILFSVLSTGGSEISQIFRTFYIRQFLIQHSGSFLCSTLIGGG